MRPPRIAAVAAAAAVALVLAGCSSPTPTVPTPTGSAKKSTEAAQSTEAPSSEAPPDEAVEPLDGEACVEVTGANLDLATASTTDAARTAADTLEKYEPPQSVQDAIEHFVGTGGAQFDDPDFSTNNDAIDKWVKQLCP